MPRALRRGTWRKSTAPRRARAKRIPRSAATIDRPPDAGDRLRNRTRRYVEVGDEPDPLLAAFGVEEDPFGASRLGKGARPGANLDVDEEEVRLRHGAAQPADRLQLLGEPAGALVVFGKALEVVVERIQARCSED